MGEANLESANQRPFPSRISGQVWQRFFGFSLKIPHYLVAPDNFERRLRSLSEQISPRLLYAGERGSPTFSAKQAWESLLRKLIDVRDLPNLRDSFQKT
jgi:hypothetical protein